MKHSRSFDHSALGCRALVEHPVYRKVLPRMVAHATRELGLPALPSQIKELNAAAIARLPPDLGRLLSHYLPKFADAGLLIRWRAKGRQNSFYAPIDWTGALPPELPRSWSNQVFEAILAFHTKHPSTPFTSRDIASQLASQVLLASSVAPCISALAAGRRLVRVGEVSGMTLYMEANAYLALSLRQRRAVVNNYTSASIDGDVIPTLAGAVASLARVVAQQRIREAPAEDRVALASRPIETAELTAALSQGLCVGPLNAKTLPAAIASATAKPRKTSKTALRRVGNFSNRHFYSVSDEEHSPYVDFRIAEFQLAKLIECWELRTLRGIARTRLSDSGTDVPAIVAVARFAEFAARVQWRRELLAQMPWRTLLTKGECEQHEALLDRALAVEAQMAHAVRVTGGGGIQLICHVPDIPDDGAVVPTLVIEAAAMAAGISRAKSTRELSGQLALKLGAVERAVSSRVVFEPTRDRKGGRARVYLRRSRVLCHLLRKGGGPTWAAIGAFAEDVLGDLSEADVFSWLLMNGNDRERMIAAACLAILDSMSAREALAEFLDDERRQPQRASAAMEFAVVGLARKPLLPRATGLEFVHQDLLKVLRRDSDRRIARLAMWALRSWEPAVTQRVLLAL